MLKNLNQAHAHKEVKVWVIICLLYVFSGKDCFTCAHDQNREGEEYLHSLLPY